MPAGAGFALVVTRGDRARLAVQYLEHTQDLSGDLGVCTAGFEVRPSICLFDYGHRADGAVDAGEYRVASVERLILFKALATQHAKHHRDLELLAGYRLRQQCGGPVGS